MYFKYNDTKYVLPVSFSKTAAYITMYHGTATGKDNQILRSILKNGLLPEPPVRQYEDPDDDVDDQTRVMMWIDSPLPGIYMTDKLNLAYDFAKNAQNNSGGDLLIVGLKIETRTPRAALDEDLLARMIMNSKFFSDVCDFMTPSLDVLNCFLKKREKWEKASIDFLKKRDKHFTIEKYRKVIPYLTETARALRLIEYIQHLHESDHEIFLDRDIVLDDVLEEAIADYKENVEKATSIMYHFAETLSLDTHNVRLDSPITYRGRNRIVSVVSKSMASGKWLQEGDRYRWDPTTIHYNKNDEITKRIVTRLLGHHARKV